MSKNREDDIGSLKMRKLSCDSCGATLDVEPGARVAVCPYCGTKLMIEEDKEIVLERIRSEERKAATSRREQEIAQKERAQLNLEASRKYKRSVTTFFTIILIVLCAFTAFFEFDTGNMFKCFVATVQVILLFFSFLMGARYIRTSHLSAYRIPKVIALLLIFVIMSDVGGYSYNSREKSEAEEIVWSDMVLGDILPEPDDLTEGYVRYNNADDLDINYFNVTKSQYNAYVKKCKEAGFTVDMTGYDTSYYAYNEDGYKVHTYYYSSKSEMTVSLDCPIQMYNITWPTTGLVSLLPQPNSLYGTIVNSSSDHFTAYIGNTTREEFIDYTSACIDAGFNVDFSQSNDYFYGDDEEGHHLSVSYEGYNTMNIYLYTRN